MTSRPEGKSLLQVVNIFATGYRYKGPTARGLPSRLRVALGNLGAEYETYRDQLPRWVKTGEIDPGAVTYAGADPPDMRPSDVEFWLFVLPSDQVVLALLLGFKGRLLTGTRAAQPISDVMERCIAGKLLINGQALDRYLDTLARSLNMRLNDEAPVTAKRRWTQPPTPGPDPHPAPPHQPIEPERHQLVLVPRHYVRMWRIPRKDVVDKIVFRSDPPYRKEFGSRYKPDQLNLQAEDGPSLGVVTPYASLIFGHKSFVEASALLSTVHAVGTASRFRQIWHEAYRQVRIFRAENQRQDVGQQRRDDLEKLADNLGNLEFDLTFSVEFPLMRIETFHSALYKAMELQQQTVTLSQMFTQLGGSVRSEITAIEIRERRVDEARGRWDRMAAGVLSFIGVSIGFIVAFLGVNAKQVDGDWSMFSSHYALLYFVAGLFAVTPLALIMFPRVRDWSHQRADLRDIVYGIILVAFGVLLFLVATHDDQLFDGRRLPHTVTELFTNWKVPDAILRALAILVGMLGLILIVLRVLRAIGNRLRHWRDRRKPAAATDVTAAGSQDEDDDPEN